MAVPFTVGICSSNQGVLTNKCTGTFIRQLRVEKKGCITVCESC